MSPSEKAQWIKQSAYDAGFMFCGISKATFLHEEANRLEAWLQKGMHAGMSYMERHADLRLDPRKLVPGAQTVISLMYNYFPPEHVKPGVHSPTVAKYAYGDDYHIVLKAKMKTLIQDWQQKWGQFIARGFTDSAPIMERAWAQRSGLGWIGKHTLLIHKKAGSFFFLAEIITDLEVEIDPPFAKDYCGSCTACIDACPTEAITPYQIDAGKCISYLTIELKDEIPSGFEGKMNPWIFGCDICQDVCPWNRFSQAHQESRFLPGQPWLEWDVRDWEALTEETFQTIFRLSPLKRAKFEGIRRNLKMLRHKPNQSSQ